MNNLAMCHTMTYNSDQTSELAKVVFSYLIVLAYIRERFSVL